MNKTVYLTKYALADGIKEIESLGESTISPGWMRLKGYAWLYKLGRDVFETLEEAKADARARRDKKIASLEKQIAKLRKMEF